MKLRNINPELADASLEEFFKKIQWGTVFSLLPQISEFYDNQLSMINVLKYYGLDYVVEGVDHMQVNCLLAEHGSNDFNKSARYYSYDRHTSDAKEGVFCFKCQKYLTPFWYLYKMERDYKSVQIKDFFLWIRRIFRVDFPRHLILDFDPDSFYTFEDVEEKQSILSKFSYAKSLRQLKDSDPKLYLRNIVSLYQTMNIGG